MTVVRLAAKAYREVKKGGVTDPYGRELFRIGLLTRYPDPEAEERDEHEYMQEGCLDRLTVMQITCYEAMVCPCINSTACAWSFS